VAGIENGFFYPSRLIQAERSAIALGIDASGSKEISQGTPPISASLEEVQRRTLDKLRHIPSDDHRCPRESFASYPAKDRLNLRHEFS